MVLPHSLPSVYYRYLHSVSRFKLRLFYVFVVGVVLHELAHVLVCKLTGITITDVVYFSPDQDRPTTTGPGGSVSYRTHRYRSAILVSVAPLLLNLPLGIALVAVITTQWPPYAPTASRPVAQTAGELLLTGGLGWVAIGAISQAPASLQDLAGVKRFLIAELSWIFEHPARRFGRLLAFPIFCLFLLPAIALSLLINKTEVLLFRELLTLGSLLAGIHLGLQWETYWAILTTISF